jgi:peptidoglycan hydrolase CwlO-like protein
MRSRILLTIIAAILFGSCSSMVKSVTQPPEALEYRKTQTEIQQQQTELAVTGVKIEESSRDLVEGLAAVESALAAPDYDREILSNQVRDLRAVAENHQTNAETLNQQLAGEREITRRQGELFNRREEVWQTAVSDRDGEIASLRMDNKKLTGQRNTLLAIVITVGIVILIFVTFKALRSFI